MEAGGRRTPPTEGEGVRQSFDGATVWNGTCLKRRLVTAVIASTSLPSAHADSHGVVRPNT